MSKSFDEVFDEIIEEQTGETESVENTTDPVEADETPKEEAVDESPEVSSEEAAEESEDAPEGEPVESGESNESDDTGTGNESEGVDESEEEPELILGKYKSVEELAKAHEEAQSKIRETGAERNEVLRELEALRTQVTEPKDKPAAPSQEQIAMQLQRNPEQGIALVMEHEPHMMGDAFEFIAETHGQGRANELMQRVNEFGTQAQVTQVEQKIEEKLAPMQEFLQRQENEAQARSIVASLEAEHGAEAVNSVKPRIAELVQQQVLEMNTDLQGNPLPQDQQMSPNASQLAAMTRMAYRIASVERTETVASRQQKVAKKQASGDFVEKGTPAQSAAPDTTPEEDNESMVREIMES